MTSRRDEPTQRRGPRPVESFGPELMSALLQGARESFEIRMPYNVAIRFRSRIHALRHAMETTKHPQYPMVAKVQLTIKWPDGTPVSKSGRYVAPDDRTTECRVRFAPNDQEFGSFLKSAGVNLELGLEKRLTIETAGDVPTKTLEELFADLNAGKS